MTQVSELWREFLSAIQFLTRVPIPSQGYKADDLARSLKFFPFVGLLAGGSAALLHWLLAPHLSRMLAAFLVISWLVWITGCLHEDGLADVADGFGGGREREQILTIMRDSRIGTYGAVALALSLLARVLLLADLPLERVGPYLVAGHVLCRWSSLPLSFYLPPARDRGSVQSKGQADGQGARIAHLATRTTLFVGTLLSVAFTVVALRGRSLLPIGAAAAVTLASGLYYRRRIGGITGDCFGATNQLTEIAVYLCGAWTL